MNNNILFTTILVLFTACVYVFKTDMIEGYYRKMNDDEETAPTPAPTPAQSTTNISYSYSRPTQNPSPRNQFTNLQSFQQITHGTQLTPNEYNTRTPQDLPNQNVMETYIPRREDYQNNNENNISGITPSGFRNGARPLTGAALLRGEVNINKRENFVHRQTRAVSQPQQGLPNSIRHATPIVSHLKY